jgi:hypothetical protein
VNEIGWDQHQKTVWRDDDEIDLTTPSRQNARRSSRHVSRAPTDADVKAGQTGRRTNSGMGEWSYIHHVSVKLDQPADALIEDDRIIWMCCAEDQRAHEALAGQRRPRPVCSLSGRGDDGVSVERPVGKAGPKLLLNAHGQRVVNDHGRGRAISELSRR